MVDLGDRVLSAASGTEPIRAGLEVCLPDRLQHQLQGGLHHPVPHGRHGGFKLHLLQERLGLVA